MASINICREKFEFHGQIKKEDLRLSDFGHFHTVSIQLSVQEQNLKETEYRCSLHLHLSKWVIVLNINSRCEAVKNQIHTVARTHLFRYVLFGVLAALLGGCVYRTLSLCVIHYPIHWLQDRDGDGSQYNQTHPVSYSTHINNKSISTFFTLWGFFRRRHFLMSISVVLTHPGCQSQSHVYQPYKNWRFFITILIHTNCQIQ